MFVCFFDGIELVGGFAASHIFVNQQNVPDAVLSDKFCIFYGQYSMAVDVVECPFNVAYVVGDRQDIPEVFVVILSQLFLHGSSNLLIYAWGYRELEVLTEAGADKIATSPEDVVALVEEIDATLEQEKLEARLAKKNKNKPKAE